MRRSSSTLPRLPRASSTEAETLRCQELLGACVKLEQVGDIIVRNMLAHVRKKMKHGLQFTQDGWSELVSFHAAVLTTAHLAFNVWCRATSRPPARSSRRRIGFATSRRRASDRHFGRLSEGTVRSLETSTIHLDTIRDLKQINSLLAAIAYPVLEERGLLRGSRLKVV